MQKMLTKRLLTKTFLPATTTKYKVDKDGYVTFTISTGGTYVLLPSKPKK